MHNQCIERLWRDMHRCATQYFHRLFYYMEHHAFLDPINEHHLFALHYIYLQKINKALSQFSRGWNSHGIRTEHGMSPNQLFTSGVLRLHRSNCSNLPRWTFSMTSMISSMELMKRSLLFKTMRVCKSQDHVCKSQIDGYSRMVVFLKCSMSHVRSSGKNQPT